MKELNKTSVDVKESNEMPTSEPSQNQIIDGLAQQVIALDKEKAQLHTEISNLEDKLIDRELTIEKNKVSYDEIYSECEDLKAKLERVEEYNEELTKANEKLHKEIKHLDEINEELVSLLEDEEEDEISPADYKACEMPTTDEGYSMSWDKKVAELYSHLEGEKTYYESQIKLLKHELIEHPQRKVILNKKLKCNTQHLNHVNRIIKAVLK